MILELTHDSIYRLPNGEEVKYMVSKDYQFIFGKGDSGKWDTVLYLVAYDSLYRLTKMPSGHMEWRITEWTLFDLEPAV